MASKEFKTEFIKLHSVKLIEEKISNPNTIVPHWDRLPSPNLVLKYGIRINNTSDLIKILFEIHIDTPEVPDFLQKTSGKFMYQFIFEIEHLNDFAIVKGEKVKLDKALEANIVGISYGTSRGLLLGRFNDTIYKECLLPVIDARNILQKNSAIIDDINYGYPKSFS